jgi:hypothetical protein
VIRYLGCKQALFREVAADEGGPTIDRADSDGPTETLGHRLAELLVAYWLECATNFPSIALGRVPWIYAERAVIHLVAGKATRPPGAEWAPRSRLDDSRDTL